jgi:predicted component of type VI protein secretion system
MKTTLLFMVCGVLVGCASNGPAAKPKQKEASKSWIGTWGRTLHANNASLEIIL